MFKFIETTALAWHHTFVKKNDDEKNRNKLKSHIESNYSQEYIELKSAHRKKVFDMMSFNDKDC